MRRALMVVGLVALVRSPLPAPLATPASPVVSQARVPASASQAPSSYLGEFVDDYGIRYVVSQREWRQGEQTRYAIVEWNVQERYLIARNAAENPSEAGLWTRIDWVDLEPGSEFGWAFCYAVYDVASADEARAAPASIRDTPRNGCNGFPFSRMRPVDPQGSTG